MATTTNITTGDSNYMQVYTVNSVNQTNIYPLIKADLSNTAYRSDVPVTLLSTKGQCYKDTSCNGKLTNLGTNSSVQPYYEFDNSIAKYGTMFVLSYYGNWNQNDGLNTIIFENPITGDSVVMDNLAIWVSSQSLLNGGSGGSGNDSGYGKVLAVGFKQLSSWKTVRIKFNHTENYIHAWVGFKSVNVGDKFIWENLSKYLIKQGTSYYSIKPEFYDDSKDIYNPQLITDIDSDSFINYGIDDISSIHCNALNKLIENKYNIALLK